MVDQGGSHGSWSKYTSSHFGIMMSVACGLILAANSSPDDMHPKWYYHPATENTEIWGLFFAKLSAAIIDCYLSMGIHFLTRQVFSELDYFAVRIVAQISAAYFGAMTGQHYWIEMNVLRRCIDRNSVGYIPSKCPVEPEWILEIQREMLFNQRDIPDFSKECVQSSIMSYYGLVSRIFPSYREYVEGLPAFLWSSGLSIVAVILILTFKPKKGDSENGDDGNDDGGGGASGGGGNCPVVADVEKDAPQKCPCDECGAEHNAATDEHLNKGTKEDLKKLDDADDKDCNKDNEGSKDTNKVEAEVPQLPNQNEGNNRNATVEMVPVPDTNESSISSEIFVGKDIVKSSCTNTQLPRSFDIIQEPIVEDDETETEAETEAEAKKCLEKNKVFEDIPDSPGLPQSVIDKIDKDLKETRRKNRVAKASAEQVVSPEVKKKIDEIVDDLFKSNSENEAEREESDSDDGEISPIVSKSTRANRGDRQRRRSKRLSSKVASARDETPTQTRKYKARRSSNKKK